MMVRLRPFQSNNGGENELPPTSYERGKDFFRRKKNITWEIRSPQRPTMGDSKDHQTEACEPDPAP